MYRYLLIGLSLFVFFGCKNDAKKTVLPNTPESVVLKWQEYVDKSMLDSARLLSTDQALGYIKYLESLIETEPLEEEQNTMMNLVCKSSGEDESVCDYYFEDEAGFQMPGRLYLAKETGQWKVRVVEDLDVSDIDTLDESSTELFPEEEGLE